MLLERKALHSSSNGDTALLVALIDFIYGVDEASVTEEEVLGGGVRPAFLDCGGHDLLKAGVDDVDLFCALDR